MSSWILPIRRRVAVLFVAGLAALAPRARAQDPQFYIFLCFGQSNMEGFPGLADDDKGPVDDRFQLLAAVDFPQLDRRAGQWSPAVPPLCRPGAGLCPADYFGRTLVAALPQRVKVGVVNVSVPGCKIELFQQDAYQDYAKSAPDWMKGVISAYGGNPYARLVELGKRAQQDGVVKGILLHQGESNTGDRQWPAKVKTVYDALLSDLNLDAEDVPLIAGEVVHADQGGVCASMNDIIAELPRTIPTAHVVSSQGCEALPDHLHFTPAGYRELGRRYAEVVAPLLKLELPKSE
jgi:hypothetical protein